MIGKGMVFKSEKDYVTEKIYVLNDIELFEWLQGKNRLLNISDNSVYSSSSCLCGHAHLDQEGFNSF